MTKWLAVLPLAVVLVLGGFFLWGLNPDRNPNEVPSILISQPVPQFELPPVDGVGVGGLSTADLAAVGEPVLVNVFASWCVPCRAEHAVLSRMVSERGIRLMGINYKDKQPDALAWLTELGNPYERIGSDLSGRAGVEWGLTGVPETFIVDGNGRVVFRYVGPIFGAEAQAEVLEALRQASENRVQS